VPDGFAVGIEEQALDLGAALGELPQVLVGVLLAEQVQRQAAGTSRPDTAGRGPAAGRPVL
jgi:hypothetical protein